MSQQNQQQQRPVIRMADPSPAIKVKDLWFSGYRDIPGETQVSRVRSSDGYMIELHPLAHSFKVEKLEPVMQSGKYREGTVYWYPIDAANRYTLE